MMKNLRKLTKIIEKNLIYRGKSFFVFTFTTFFSAYKWSTHLGAGKTLVYCL